MLRELYHEFIRETGRQKLGKNLSMYAKGKLDGFLLACGWTYDDEEQEGMLCIRRREKRQACKGHRTISGGKRMKKTAGKIAEFTEELFISCILIFILPLLYLLALLSGQLFTKIWEIREYNYKTDGKESRTSGNESIPVIHCQYTDKKQPDICHFTS